MATTIKEIKMVNQKQTPQKVESKSIDLKNWRERERERNLERSDRGRFVKVKQFFFFFLDGNGEVGGN